MGRYTGGKPFEVSAAPPKVDSGYDVKAVRLSKTRRDHALAKQNATLHDGETYVRFFCSDTDLNLALAGMTAQSHYVRDFYPHNIVIPPITVTGECLDQHDYARMVEFIHQAQRKGAANHTLTQLEVKAGGSNLTQSGGNAIVKGRHKPIVAQGYIPRMPREYRRFEYAPKFTFQFIIVEMVEGIFHNALTEEPSQRSWLEIIKSLVEPPLSPTKKEVRKDAPEILKGADEIANAVLKGLEGLQGE